MKKRVILILIMLLAVQSIIAGCGVKPDAQGGEDSVEMNRISVKPDAKITELEEDLSVVRYEGNNGLDAFLEQGGADSDEEVVRYVGSQLSSNIPELIFGGNPFGCSTLSVKGTEGGYLFGRNFDWNACKALIISSSPDNGYASVSTVNTNFIQAGGLNISGLPDAVQAFIGLYAPLDGINEKGLAVSVNMIEDSDTIEQNTEKPDITTTTAIRLLLNRAANVEEAVNLLQQYDMHASMGMMVHFAVADAEGQSVVVEYVDHEMLVTETPVVTNFYLAEGGKYGVGTAQSHTRYDLLEQALEEHETMTEAEVRDALDSVSKDNFGEFESTEWSIVMNLEKKEAVYYHRENYGKGYIIPVE